MWPNQERGASAAFGNAVVLEQVDLLQALIFKSSPEKTLFLAFGDCGQTPALAFI
jgi:hypothetical protein